MSQGLAECRKTLRHVRTKLNNLKRSIERYDFRACKVVPDDNLEASERLYRLSEVQEPPLNISIQVTEITCIMRAALDHLMYLIWVQANNGTEPPPGFHTPYFPTVKDSAQFDKDIADCNRKMARLNGYPTSLDQAVVHWLKSHQHYTATDDKTRPLIVLNDIVRVAKHRFHIKTQASRTKSRGSILSMSGFGEGCVVENNVINGIGVAKFEVTPADFKDGEIVGRVVLGINLRAPLSMGRSITWTSDPLQIPLTKEMMDLLMGELSANIKVTTQLLFGPSDGIAEGLPVYELLNAIFTYLDQFIFGSNPITDSL